MAREILIEIDLVRRGAEKTDIAVFLDGRLSGEPQCLSL